ncbi:MAG TPA: hypothetical protein VLF41_01580 [Candidatus Nanoarchaeia archaeon]|nr:hypothetical protein [Candidatus Nanoarchaeia archaeon]
MKTNRLLKIGLPIALPVGLILTAAAVVGQGASRPSVLATQNAASDNQAEVTVNGQSIDVPDNSSKTVDSGNGSTTVQVSGGSQTASSPATTTITNSDGNVSITVTQSSNNTSSSTSTNVSSFSSSFTGNNSSVHFSSNGTGNVTVTK